jgi:RimJ/RimL family protein N-acetyltransferase
MAALDRQPTLAGPTLRLRPLIEGDRDALAAAASDPLIWEQHPDPERWRPEGFARFFEDALASGGALVVLDRDGAVVGTSRYEPVDERRVEIGWTFLVRRCWGGPANRELKRLMLDHAFDAVDAVEFRVGADNRRSRRAVEKLGARLDREIDTPLGPHVVYALARADWQAADARS